MASGNPNPSVRNILRQPVVDGTSSSARPVTLVCGSPPQIRYRNSVPNPRFQYHGKRNSLRTKSVQYDLEEAAAFGDVEDELTSPEDSTPESGPDLLDACTQTSPFSLSSESSPVSPDRGFAILDPSDVLAAATPDSTKSFSSSEGSVSLAVSGSLRSGLHEFPHRGVGSDTQVLESDSFHALFCHSDSSQTADQQIVGISNIYDYPPGAGSREPPPPSPKSRTPQDSNWDLGECEEHSTPARPRHQALVTSSLPALDRTGSLEIVGSGGDGEMFAPSTSLGAAERQRTGSSAGNFSQGSDSGFCSVKEKAEIEAVESCKWLRAAGFPQYAQMYEDHRFPIDVKAVEKDHEFLDEADLHALFRRLHALNRCAIMKLDSGVVMRRGHEDDSDEENSTVALSRKWRYQRKSKTWSRIENEMDLVGNTDSSTSPNLLSSIGTTSGKAAQDLGTGTGPTTGHMTGDSLDSLTFDTLEKRPPVHVIVAQRASAKTAEDILGVGKPTAPSGIKLQRSQSERFKDKARAFMRRVGPSGSRKKKSASVRQTSADSQNRENIVIGSPVLVAHQSASPPSMRMFKGVTDSPRDTETPAKVVNLHRTHHAHAHVHAQDGKRHGRVFLMSDSSTEFEKVDPTGSPVAYIDNNSNIDRVFVPRLPAAGNLNSNNSNLAGNSSKRAVVAPASSPVLAGAERVLEGSGRGQRPAGSGSGQLPLILFNKSYSVGPNYGLEEQGQIIADLDSSSPEMLSKDSTGGSRGRSLNLKVHMEVDPVARGGQRPAPSSSPDYSSEDTDSRHFWEAPERRDSGVGSSLSRSPSGPSKSRVRWHSFQRQHKHRMSSRNPSQEIPTDSLSLPQLIVVRQLALLKLTSLMEKYCGRHSGSRGPGGGPHPHGGQGWNWGVQKLFRRMKSPEHSKIVKDKMVFGVPLNLVAQRTGQPLPQRILHAMRYLRQQAPDAVGIFRKSGVRSRIQKLKEGCESSSVLPVYDASQAFDVADMLKQYFRELPEPLLTNKLSETFISIQLDVPEEYRLEAMQKAVLLLPDENREVLQSLLLFLYDVSRYAKTNQMTAENLAVCFAPSLFQLSQRVAALSPTRRHKTITGGLPNEKELRENSAAQGCMSQMIAECKRLFLVPKGIAERCNFENLAADAEPTPLKELGQPHGNYLTYLEGCIATLLKEHRERWKGWVTEGSLEGVEITYKKLTDSHPLKLWRCWADVEAPPKELLERVLRERDLWDEDLVKWRVVKNIVDQCELFQYVQNDMPPHPTREYCVLRLWKTDLSSLRGGCVLVETSVTSQEAPKIGGVRGVCLASRFLIEPSGAGKSRVTYVCRIDTKGRGKGWYSQVFGYICARQIGNLRDSFKQTAQGPETKV